MLGHKQLQERFRQEANEDAREPRVRERILFLGKVELSRQARQY